MDTSLEKEVKKEFVDFLNCYGFLGICYLSVSLSLTSSSVSPMSVETLKDLKAQVLLLETGSYVSTCQEILLIPILRSLAVSLWIKEKY